MRMAPDGVEEDGEWFSLWITDLESAKETWIGSLKFPLQDGEARMMPRASATIELYGSEWVRPVDVPVWHVSVGRPLGDGVPATGIHELPLRRFPERAPELGRQACPCRGKSPLGRWRRHGTQEPRKWDHLRVNKRQAG